MLLARKLIIYRYASYIPGAAVPPMGPWLFPASCLIYNNVRTHSASLDKEEQYMGRIKEFPRNNVVSMRITDDELRRVENLMENTHKSLSNIMREAIEYFAVNQEKKVRNLHGGALTKISLKPASQ
jgi:hypothetical protein